MTKKGTASKKETPAKKDTPDRVFLVVIDDSAELHQALYYACLRAKRLDGRILLAYCIVPGEFQHWVGVGELMKNEARAEAENILRTNAEWVQEITGKMPAVHLREGDSKTEIIDLINEEDGISMLILGANTAGDNPGPLVSHLTTKGACMCRIPITIVPGNLSDEDIERLT